MNYVNVHGKLPVGSCTFTTSGKLKDKTGIKYVIHTVGPNFSEHPSECVLKLQIMLYDSIYNSFVAANKLGCRSISIPAISSGIFGCPVSLCA